VVKGSNEVIDNMFTGTPRGEVLRRIMFVHNGNISIICKRSACEVLAQSNHNVRSSCCIIFTQPDGPLG
jgi:hypothetical protein